MYKVWNLIKATFYTMVTLILIGIVIFIIAISGGIILLLIPPLIIFGCIVGFKVYLDEAKKENEDTK